MGVLSIGFDIASNASTLFLLSIGLALVFGTRGIINLAHGEFVMLGCYAAIQLVKSGVWFPVAVLIAAILVGFLGIVLERLIIRHLYDRVADCMLATWGVSLIAVQVTTIVFGSTTAGISIPLGTFSIGQNSKAAYNAVIIALAGATLGALYLLMRRSSFGLRARVVARDSAMAQAIGIDIRRVDAVTFFVGAASAGFAGAVLAPVLGVAPTMGTNFIANVFMTVIVGGANFIIGTPAAAGLLGGTQSGLATAFTPIIGQIGLLIVAILIVRLRPGGLSSGRARKS